MVVVVVVVVVVVLVVVVVVVVVGCKGWARNSFGHSFKLNQLPNKNP